MFKRVVRATKMYARLHLINFFILLSSYHVKRGKKYNLIAQAMYKDLERRYSND